MNIHKLTKFLNDNKLYGRHTEIDFLDKLYQKEDSNRRLFMNGRFLFISGFHAIGKTTLILNYCFNRLENRTDKLFYIDFQNPTFSSEEAFVKLIRDELNIIAKNRSLPKSFNELFVRELDEHISSMADDSIIVFDEIERFLEFFDEKKFIQILRAFIRISDPNRENEKKPLIVIITKNDWLEREWRHCIYESPVLGRRSSQLILGAIDGSSCRNLIDVPLDIGNNSETFRNEIIDFILLLSGGHPYIIKQALNILNMDGKNINNKESFIEILGEGLIVSCKSYMEKIWFDISEDEKEVVVSIIAGEFGRIERIEHEKDSICSSFYGTNGLVKKGILQEPNKTTFSPLFTWWVYTNEKELFKEIDKNRSSMDVPKVKNIVDIINTSTIVAKTFATFLKTYFLG